MANFFHNMALDHHQEELWRVIRRFLFQNGRIARIGGEHRVRYCYCQEYLLPSLLYAADRLGESRAGVLIEGVMDMIGEETAWSKDGSFFGRRSRG
ncbi:MAG: hypothetical protein ACOC2T_01500 [Planctomycetota bacterium]